MMRLSLWLRSKRIFKTLLASSITSERSPGYPQTSSKPPWYPLGVLTLTSRTSFMESRQKGSPSRFGILGSPLRLGASRGETSNTLRINVPGSYPLGMGNTSPRSDGRSCQVRHCLSSDLLPYPAIYPSKHYHLHQQDRACVPLGREGPHHGG